MSKGTYTAADITVLEGIDAVRKRPGMYIGGTGTDGLHHLLWEVVDNACDEAQNGHATEVIVTLHEDGQTITVDDDGRGIPVDVHPTTGKGALEIIFTVLHSGSKFGGGGYETAGGLHGVGASAVNALSSTLIAMVKRDNQLWMQEFRKGRPKANIESVGPARGTGTSITFTPDSEIFEEIAFDPERILRQLEVKAFLHRGLKVVFRDLAHGADHTLVHEGGIVDYLQVVLGRVGAERVVEPTFVVDRSSEEAMIEVAVAWTEAPNEKVLSYVNGIPTDDGGTHEQGFRDALVKAMRSFIETHGLQPRGIQFQAEDLREGVYAVLSARIREPQFQGQTKGRLNNPEVRGAVDAAVRPVLEQWLHENRSMGELIVNRAVQAVRARLASREAENTVRRKSATSGRLNLPGKLADCSSNDPSESELFVVEGDSAGGSAKQARDRRTQAILPLRGKVLNAEQAGLKKVLDNEELNNLVLALGTGIGGDFRLDRLRYERIVLLMDADSDGHHISTLLLTFLYRYMTPLLEHGHVYLALPPLYRIVAGKANHWALDDADRDRILRKLPARARPEITRFKGLGEMPPKTLFETTLDPEKRRLLQVTLADPIETHNVVADLMGKDPAPRYRFIMDRSAEVDVESLERLTPAVRRGVGYTARGATEADMRRALAAALVLTGCPPEAPGPGTLDPGDIDSSGYFTTTPYSAYSGSYGSTSTPTPTTPTAISSVSVGCAQHRLQIYVRTSGWTTDGLVYLVDTTAPEPQPGENHTIASYAFAQDGSWDHLKQILTLGGYEPDVSTDFACADAVQGRLTWAVQVFGLDGLPADCLLGGDDPGGWAVDPEPTTEEPVFDPSICRSL